MLQDLARGEEVGGKVLLATYHMAKSREFDTAAPRSTTCRARALTNVASLACSELP